MRQVLDARLGDGHRRRRLDPRWVSDDQVNLLFLFVLLLLLLLWAAPPSPTNQSRGHSTVGLPDANRTARLETSDLVYIAPSGVQKELMKPSDMYVLSLAAQAASLDRRNRVYLRSPAQHRPSQCTPLFLAAFTKRRAGCCIHTHSQWAVLVTLILEAEGQGHGGQGAREFRINNIEQIKGFGRGFGKTGNLGYHDTLVVPVIENTAHEEDLTEYLEEAMDKYPDTYAVLVRRHGVYVWGDNVHKAKTQCERFALPSPHTSGCVERLTDHPLRQPVWTISSNSRLR